MTKEKMLNFIESTGMVIDFDRKYLMRRSKEYITGLYVAAMHYAARHSWVTSCGSIYIFRRHTSKKNIEFVIDFSVKYVIIFMEIKKEVNNYETFQKESQENRVSPAWRERFLV